MSLFQFKPRWKEELVCIGPGGAFVLDFPMGVPTVYFPTQHAWAQCAPDWARELWPVLKTELEAWCETGNVQFVLDGSASAYPTG